MKEGVTTSSSIKPLMSPEYESSVNMMLNAAIGLVIGFGLGAAFVLFKHKWN